MAREIRCTTRCAARDAGKVSHDVDIETRRRELLTVPSQVAPFFITLDSKPAVYG